ncbi:Hypothetical predicted protein [Paramuricea clavata]|uniref:Uncharacterized protein n=1 Tax=Paramuricea clavata TaxID=317549 RepID=A0A6S7G3K1_PARCT|nr:Hypothetical predicted protein [Paramuricea clavata]
MDEIIKVLKRSFEAVQTTVKQWEETQKSSNGIVESLLNLSEQLQCCEEGSYEHELRNEFPDLKSRVLFKIMKVLEGKMEKLREVLQTFERLKNNLQKVRNTVFQVYTEYSDKVDIENLTTGSPTFPPYVLMFEWIMDITRWYNNLYEQKKDLVNNISYEDKAYFQSLVKKWKDDSSLFRVKGILEQVSMFISGPLQT